MGLNELFLLLTAVACMAVVYTAWRIDKERLYSAILIFLILISITGGKIVEYFGHETNTGNIFYASVFLATYFLIERYGKREGIRSIWIGIIGVIFFSILVQLVVLQVSSPNTGAFGAALDAAFAPSFRLALASLCGYGVSQTLNVHLFIYLSQYFEGRLLWLRANIANVCAQVLDSLIFFTIAFWGVVPPDNMNDIIATGFVIKVAFMMIASLLLYLNRFEEQEESGFTSIAFR